MTMTIGFGVQTLDRVTSSSEITSQFNKFLPFTPHNPSCPKLLPLPLINHIYLHNTGNQHYMTWKKTPNEINSSASVSANGFQWVNSWGVDGAIPGFKSSKQLNTMPGAAEVPASRPCLIHLHPPPHPRRPAASGTAQPPKKRHHFLSICAAGRALYKHILPFLPNTLTISHSVEFCFSFSQTPFAFSHLQRNKESFSEHVGACAENGIH